MPKTFQDRPIKAIEIQIENPMTEAELEDKDYKWIDLFYWQCHECEAFVSISTDYCQCEIQGN